MALFEGGLEGPHGITVLFANNWIVVFDRQSKCWMWEKELGRFGFSIGNHGSTASSCTDMKPHVVSSATARGLIAYLSNVGNFEMPKDDDEEDRPVPTPEKPEKPPEEPPRKVAPGPGSRFGKVPAVHLGDNRVVTDVGRIADTDRGFIRWEG